jgi:hypothetical protein
MSVAGKEVYLNMDELFNANTLLPFGSYPSLTSYIKKNGRLFKLYERIF